MIHDQQSIASQRNEVVIPEYPNVSKPVLLLFCSYVIIWYLQVGSRISFLGEIRIELIVACLLLPLALRTHSKSKIEMDSSLLPIIIVYFLLLLMMTLFSYDFQTSWNVFFNRVLKFAFMALFIVCFVKSPTGMRFFLVAFMLACMKMGQEGLLGQLTGSLVWQNQGVMRLHGSTSLYRHPNSFAGMALGTIPFIYTLWPISNRFVKTALIVQLVFALNIVIYTGSRTGYVGFIILLVFVFYKSKVRKKFLLYGIIFSLISFPLIPQQYVERFETIFTQQDKEGRSIETRMQILEDAWQIFLAHPLGVGISAFPAIRKDIFGRVQDTHNLYLEVVTNLGIQGLIVFFMLVFKMFKMLNELKNNISFQIKQLMESLFRDGSSDHVKQQMEKHLRDLKLMEATCNAVYLFIILRLGLGFFGMDLYEIYWWFAAGITISLFNINKVAVQRSEEMLSSFTPIPSGAR